MEFKVVPWDRSMLALQCPNCDGDVTHITSVMVAARQEDAEFTNREVEVVFGNISVPREVPAGRLGAARRSRVALVGYCELCDGGSFAIVFTQHKGTTFIEAVAVDENTSWADFNQNVKIH